MALDIESGAVRDGKRGDTVNVFYAALRLRKNMSDDGGHYSAGGVGEQGFALYHD
ncbi:MAG: hypothetical protein LBT01_00040 [Spirochaetaceae bacterium]|jgi:hypothetical protein|nr:hypothetical protein [Spirochaetaceae bacterium]